MSELTIWNALRSGGLSEAGAAGVMGNFYCESLLIPNNVENRCPLSDSDYTYNVDHGIISKDVWQSDGYGYGLYQLTFWSRKKGYYEYVKAKGLSIADEASQCEYCLKELKSDYKDLYYFLQQTDSVYDAAFRFCDEFEQPAINNIDPRYNAAQGYYSKFAGTIVSNAYEDESPAYVPKNETTESTEICVRTVRSGDTGTDVAMLQTGLNKLGYSCGNADGIFGNKTTAAVNQMKQECNLTPDGIVTGDVWQILFQ